jgi:hypothetical protein
VIHGPTDVFQYTVKICHDLIVPIAKNAKAVGLQIRRSLPVCMFLIRMMPAIELDNDKLLGAAEIHNVWTYRMLPSEFQTTELSGPEMLPQ